MQTLKKTYKHIFAGGLAIAAPVLLAGAHAPSWMTRLDDIVLSRIAANLESRFPPAILSPSRPITGVVLLGGGLERSRQAALLASLYPQAKLILSGTSSDEDRLIAALEDDLSRRLIVDRRPQDTYENAVYSKDLANPRPGERWLVVTSALHMPRAIGSFRSVGFQVEPWPVAAASNAPEHAQSAVQHELMGLFYYWLTGRTHDLVPSG